MTLDFVKDKCLVCGAKVSLEKRPFDYKISCSINSGNFVIFESNFMILYTDKYIFEICKYSDLEYLERCGFSKHSVMFEIRIKEKINSEKGQYFYKIYRYSEYLIPSTINDDYIENLLLLD